MNQLTITAAKSLALSIFKDLTPDFHRNFQQVHSHKVGRIAKMIGHKLNIESDIFEIAGWTHDIGYCKDHEEHAQHSVRILQEHGFEVDLTLSDCILNHGNNKTPETLEGRIFQLSDKLSVFDADLIEVMLRNSDFPQGTEAIDFLKSMSEKSFKIFEKFQIQSLQNH